MLRLRHTYRSAALGLLANVYFCLAFDTAIKELGVGKTSDIADDQDLDYEMSEDTWLEISLRDIAYYLRNFKFDEWDRRFYEHQPPEHLIGFYKSFPNPSLKSVHWEVREHCHDDFLKCIIYLHRMIVTAPFTRNDDITTILSKNSTTLNHTLIERQNSDCKKALLYTEKTGLPFDGPKEKFYWRTSASYYMCWYTMKENPALSMLGESCDNFASCLDRKFGNRNHDPRSNDKLSFACALYSFCPDPCCPSKHVKTLHECVKNSLNPCYMVNIWDNSTANSKCTFNRKENQNLEHIMENKWNVSCSCRQNGFIWDSRFGMCVDINECATKENHCDSESEDCLNLPGSYRCVCKWGYIYSKADKRCVEHNFIQVKVEQNSGHFDFRKLLNSFLEYIS